MALELRKITGMRGINTPRKANTFGRTAQP